MLTRKAKKNEGVRFFSRPWFNEVKGPEVSVIVVSYNSRNYIGPCLSSLMKQDYSDYQIIVVDNASNNGSTNYIGENFPSVHLVTNSRNLGFPEANNVGSRVATGKYLVFINPDTEVKENWLSELIKPLKQNQRVAITTSKVMYFDRKHINACGLLVHYTGLTLCRGCNSSSPSCYTKTEMVFGASGCSFAIRKDIFNKLNGFDGELFLYMEDVDISWRARLYGFEIIYVPTSIVYHHYKMDRFPWQKFYFLERNRCITVLKNYQKRTLALLTFALMMTEIITWVFALRKGKEYVAAKLTSYLWILRNRSRILEKRKQVEAIRVVPDSRLVRYLATNFPFESHLKGLRRLLHLSLIKIANREFYEYYKLVDRFI